MTAFERWVRDRVAEPLQISRAAAAIGVSERTLQRTTAAVLGMSPTNFVHEIRLDEATFLLRTTSQTLDAIAAAVGYQQRQHAARPGPAAARHHPQRAAPDSSRPLITRRRAAFGARRCRRRTLVPSC